MVAKVPHPQLHFQPSVPFREQLNKVVLAHKISCDFREGRVFSSCMAHRARTALSKRGPLGGLPRGSYRGLGI
jgi:hypothetical protein